MKNTKIMLCLIVGSMVLQPVVMSFDEHGLPNSAQEVALYVFDDAPESETKIADYVKNNSYIQCLNLPAKNKLVEELKVIKKSLKTEVKKDLPLYVKPFGIFLEGVVFPMIGSGLSYIGSVLFGGLGIGFFNTSGLEPKIMGTFCSIAAIKLLTIGNNFYVKSNKNLVLMSKIAKVSTLASEIQNQQVQDDLNKEIKKHMVLTF